MEILAFVRRRNPGQQVNDCFARRVQLINATL
jgi:hypothetical protein